MAFKDLVVAVHHQVMVFPPAMQRALQPFNLKVFLADVLKNGLQSLALTAFVMHHDGM